MARTESSARRRKYADGLERLAATFIQAFAAVWIVTGDLDWLTIKAALVAGGLSVAKTAAAWQLGNKETSSVLPEELDPATPPGQK